GGEGQGARGGLVVAAGGGGAVGRGVVDRHRLGAGLVHADGEGQRGGVVIALDDRGVADAERGRRCRVLGGRGSNEGGVVGAGVEEGDVPQAAVHQGDVARPGADGDGAVVGDVDVEGVAQGAGGARDGAEGDAAQEGARGVKVRDDLGPVDGVDVAVG